MRELVLKLAVLFSFCGGPLFVSNLLKPRLDERVAFAITFLPVLFELIGTFCLEDSRNRWTIAAVAAGRLAILLTMSMHVYALWSLLNGVRVYDPYLHYFGIVVGVVWSIAYLRAERRWASSLGSPGAHDPIEPS